MSECDILTNTIGAVRRALLERPEPLDRRIQRGKRLLLRCEADFSGPSDCKAPRIGCYRTLLRYRR